LHSHHFDFEVKEKLKPMTSLRAFVDVTFKKVVACGDGKSVCVHCKTHIR
jgi:hypothetical protein